MLHKLHIKFNYPENFIDRHFKLVLNDAHILKEKFSSIARILWNKSFFG